MKKNLFMTVAAAALLLSGCDYNDKYFDWLDEATVPTDVKTLEYKLETADYATISSNSSNVAIAKAAGVSAQLTAVKTNMYLTDVINAETYIPAFLAAKWYTADDGSSVKVTYQKMEGVPAYVTALNATSTYKVSNTDYATVWGSSSSNKFFTPTVKASAYIPTFLKTAYPSAETGAIVAVDYNQSEKEPSGSVVGLNETVDSYLTTSSTKAELTGWLNITTTGTYFWNGKNFSSNGYIQASAYKHTAGPLETYMISPSVSVKSGMKLSFSACYGNYTAKGGTLSVLVSENFSGETAEAVTAATWKDVTSNFTIEIPTANYGTLAKVGEADLSSYAGKNVRIAFKYTGDGTTGATTTVQVDNIVVKSEGAGGTDVYAATTALYAFDGTKWAPYSANANAYMMTKADFNLLNSTYDNFSSTMNPDVYLPLFLSKKYLLIEGTVVTPVYKFYNSTTKVTTVRADEYTYTSGAWVKNNGIVTVTDQFVRNAGKWTYNPSVVITLVAGKNLPESAKYYQAITDAVKAEKGSQYVTSYGNNDYYYGGSAFQNNFDFRPSAWKAQTTEYANMTDEQLTALMYERLPESFIYALKAIHPDAAPVAGVDVTYTFNFVVYDGTNNTNYTIVYKVTGAGQFEYVEGSLAKK